MRTIGLLKYVWNKISKIPPCDSCKHNKSEYKIYTNEVGMRLCLECLEYLRIQMKKIGEIGQ